MLDVIVRVHRLSHFGVTVGTVETSELFDRFAMLVFHGDIFQLPLSVCIQEERWFCVGVGVCVTSYVTSAA